MTRDEKREWLGRYRALLRRAKAVEEELQELRGAALPASPVIDGMPRGQGGGSIVEAAALEVAEAEAELSDIMAAARAARAEILAAIAGLSGIAYDVMRKRYIGPRDKTWDEIAGEVYLSPDRARHVHIEALDKLDIPERRDAILYGIA